MRLGRSLQWKAAALLLELRDLGIDETNPMAHGVAGRYSRLSANQIAREADLIVAVGSSVGDVTTDGDSLFAPGCRLAHIDIDASALGRSQAEDFSVRGDAQRTLAQLREALEIARDRRGSLHPVSAPSTGTPGATAR